MTVRVARLGVSDWRIFAGLRLRALTDSLGEHDPHFREEAAFTAAQWRRRLHEHAQFAALIDDRAVGIIAAQRENPQTVYLYSLWLDPSVRGCGLAHRLVSAAVEWARSCRARNVRLRVAADNATARGVYESLGFTVVTEPCSDSGQLAMWLTVG